MREGTEKDNKKRRKVALRKYPWREREGEN
jgi:hypothetical protein